MGTVKRGLGAGLPSPLPLAEGAGGGPNAAPSPPAPDTSRNREGNLESTPFWEKPLASLSRREWEALCDGCGKCCLHKLEDEDTGAFYPTNVACRLLDLSTARCSDYRNRRAFVPDCVRLTPRLAGSLGWLPESCAYRLRADGKPLPQWHYLVCGDRDAVHRAGVSVIGKAVSEDKAGPLEHHIVWTDDDEEGEGEGDD